MYRFTVLAPNGKRVAEEYAPHEYMDTDVAVQHAVLLREEYGEGYEVVLTWSE